jgi:hypothetical protein
MIDDFSKYKYMQLNGRCPEEVFYIARRDGLDPIALIRMIRAVFGLNPHDAKVVMQTANQIDYPVYEDEAVETVKGTVSQSFS